jgi:peptidoglycan/LPS O-acetylase OafA/YrhL
MAFRFRSFRGTEARSLPKGNAYRPDIDGLRAVAVLSVVAFHYGATWLPGGFSGVDIFFVISGYLITETLRSDMELGPQGWLLRFYQRRIKRLLPALLTVLLFTVVASHLILLPGDLQKTSASAAYSAFGLGNIFFYNNTGYFDREAELQPLLHMWSLGVEEQFYLAWPFVLFACIKWRKNHAYLPFICLAAIAMASFVINVYQIHHNPKAAFYLPFARAWELAIGGMLSFTPPVQNPRYSKAMTAAGLALIVAAVIGISADMPFPGYTALLPVLGACLIVQAKQETRVTLILSNGPLVRIGLITYSMYLWHWPIYVLFKHLNNGMSPDATETAILSAFTVTVSYASWRYIERLRRTAMPAVKTVAVGLAICTIFAGTVVLASKDAELPAQQRGLSSLDMMWQWHCDFQATFSGLPLRSCVVGSNWDNAAKRIVIWGDSHGEHYAPLIEAAAPQNSSIIIVTPCPAIFGGSVRRDWKEVPDYVETCKQTRAAVLKLLHQQRIDLLVIAASWSTVVSQATHDTSMSDTATGADMIERGIREIIPEVPAQTKVLLAGQFPRAAGDPVPCSLGMLRIGCTNLWAGMSAIYKEDSNIDDLFTRLAMQKPSQISSVAPGRRLCDASQCIHEVNGEPLYRDRGHIRRNLSPEALKAIASLSGLDDALNRSLD